MFHIAEWQKSGIGRRIIWFGAVLSVLALTGCIRYEADIVVNDDGSGSVNQLAAANAELVIETLGEFDFGAPISRDEICEDFLSEEVDSSMLPADAEVTPYDEDGFCGARIAAPLPASDDHSELIAEIFDDAAAKLAKEGDRWVFEVDLNTEEFSDDDMSGLPEEMVNTLFGEASITVAIDLPGTAVDGENNADTVGSDGRFEWDIDFLDPPGRLFATTEPGSDGGGSFAKILLLVVALLVLGAVAWWFLNRRDSEPANGAGTTPPNGKTDPVFDESLNAWVIDHPEQGRLIHDASTDTWKPLH